MISVAPAAAPKPSPLPGGNPVEFIASKPLVRFAYKGTEQLAWKDNGGLWKRAASGTSDRKVETSAPVFAMPLATKENIAAYMSGVTLPGHAKRLMPTAARTFEQAVKAAAQAAATSIGANQAVAVIQAAEGKYLLAPLGVIDTWNRFFHDGSVWFPTGNPGFLQEVTKATEFVPPVPEKAGERKSTFTTKLVAITPNDPRVHALVSSTSFYDLRQGTVTADPEQV